MVLNEKKKKKRNQIMGTEKVFEKNKLKTSKFTQY